MMLIKIILFLLLTTQCYAGLKLASANDIRWADNDRLDALTDDRMIEFQFKSADTGAGNIMILKDGGEIYYQCDLSNTGQVYAYAVDSDEVLNDVLSDAGYNDDVWHHVFIYIESNTLYLYVDNVLAGSDGGFTGNLLNDGKLIVGSNNYDGMIANIIIRTGNKYAYYRNQYQRFQMPDSNTKFHAPLWENTGTAAYSIDHPRLTTDTWDNATWGADPPLTYYKDGCLPIEEIYDYVEDFYNIEFIIVVHK